MAWIRINPQMAINLDQAVRAEFTASMARVWMISGESHPVIGELMEPLRAAVNGGGLTRAKGKRTPVPGQGKAKGDDMTTREHGALIDPLG